MLANIRRTNSIGSAASQHADSNCSRSPTHKSHPDTCRGKLDEREIVGDGELSHTLSTPWLEAKAGLPSLLLLGPGGAKPHLDALGLGTRKQILLDGLERGLQQLRQVRHHQGASAAL